MARIGATLSGIERTLLNRLAEANAAATLNVLRLAEGKRLLSPAHDPSQFTVVSQFETQLNNIRAAMANTTGTIVGPASSGVSPPVLTCFEGSLVVKSGLIICQVCPLFEVL